jgi:NADPH:quinone reductase-like Zn-dependent oxidoreductase
MKGIICNGYGKAADVFQVSEIEQPIPKENEILINVKASAVNSADWRLRKGEPFAVRFFFGFSKPKYQVLGGVFAGKIVAVGKNVTKYKIGEEIFGSTALEYGFGAYAEYKTLHEAAPMALKPINLNCEQAAVIPFGGTTALHFLKKADLQKDQRVLINGASGGVGTAMLQIAKYYGAHITAMCSISNIDLVKSLGADVVIDYTSTNLTEIKETFDVIIDCVDKLSISQALKHLTKNGKLLLVSAGISEMIYGAWISMTRKQKVIFGIISETAEDMEFLKYLVENNHLQPVIDRFYAMEEIAEAHEYVEKGHKKGNVVIKIG